jgi:hypothetical protein
VRGAMNRGEWGARAKKGQERKRVYKKKDIGDVRAEVGNRTTRMVKEEVGLGDKKPNSSRGTFRLTAVQTGRERVGP